jgi:hypothetical protein
MPLPHADTYLDNPRADDRIAILEARLRLMQEALADQLISRRLDRDRIAVLNLEVQDLRETITSLRRAITVAKPDRTEDRRRRRTP